METIQELMIEHGASIQFVDKICTIRVNNNYPFKAIVKQVLRDLRSIIYSNEYMHNYLKLC